ncbi:MAG: hypothetical protein IIB87_01320 [Chloroflexi bacterium]|nr:hypothetical protein [Chloroflexota bacterium]
MSLAPSKRRPSAKPAIDLGHSFDGFAAVHHPDGHFLFRRIEESLLCEAPAAGSVTLDVACGAGKLAALDRIGHRTPALADIIVSVWVSVWRPGTERQRA